MRLALLGYGKMGKKIEEIAIVRGHEVVLRVDEYLSDWALDGVDVAIDFSSPEVAFAHISRALSSGVPVVSGTTGWLDRWEEALSLCGETGGAFLYASNFSLGVNLFFELNRRLSELMAPYPDYAASLYETHHIHKKDSPSGTAISLAEEVIRTSGRYSGWRLAKLERPIPSEEDQPSGSIQSTLPVYSYREGEVPGTHRVDFASQVDRISIEHEARNRDGFALGALMAAEWLRGKTGVFSMKDVLAL